MKKLIFILIVISVFQTTHIDNQLFAQDKTQLEELNELGRTFRDDNPEKAIKIFEQAIKLQNSDTLNVEFIFSLRNIGVAYTNINSFETAENYLKRALFIAEKIRNPFSESDVCNNLGHLYTLTGRLDEAKDFLRRNIEIEKKHERLEDATLGMDLLALIFTWEGNYSQALELRYQALSILIKIDDKPGQADILNNIGAIYMETSQFFKALECFNRALLILLELNSNADIAMVYNNIGSVMIVLNRPNEAKFYINKSIDIRKEISDSAGLAHSYLKMGELFRSLKKFDEAEEWFFKSIEITLKEGNYFQLATNFHVQGMFCLDVNDTIAAINNFKNSLEFARQINYHNLMLEIYSVLTDIYVKQENFENAYKYSNLKLELIEKGVEVDRNFSKLIIQKDSVYKNSKNFSKMFFPLLMGIVFLAFFYIFVLRRKLQKSILIIRNIRKE